MTLVLPGLDDQCDEGTSIEIDGLGCYTTHWGGTLLSEVSSAWVALTGENICYIAIADEVRAQISVLEDNRPGGGIKVSVSRSVCFTLGEFIRAAAGKCWGFDNLPEGFDGETAMGLLSQVEIAIKPKTPRSWSAFFRDQVHLADGKGPNNGMVIFISNRCFGKVIHLHPVGTELLQHQAAEFSNAELPRIERDVNCGIARIEGLCGDCINRVQCHEERERRRVGRPLSAVVRKR